MFNKVQGSKQIALTVLLCMSEKFVTGLILLCLAEILMGFLEYNRHSLVVAYLKSYSRGERT